MPGVRVLSDERLARLVARGNARAFAVIYERHHAALHRYCRSIVRDDEDARDALQSALMCAFAALQAGERDVAVRPWLFRIVHNEAISLLRRRRVAAVPVDEQTSASVSVAGVVEERERFATLVADLQSLPERQRAALVMRELSGLSIEELAAALSTSPGAAKQTLFEARCALHELAEGRAMRCETIRQTLSERDGRVLRARKLRAHLRACAGCRDFGERIETRSADLRALVPPPAVAAAGMLARVLAHGAAGGNAGGVSTGAAATLGAPAAASFGVKTLTCAAIAVVAAAGTATIVVHHPDRQRERSAMLGGSSHPTAHGRLAARETTPVAMAGGGLRTARAPSPLGRDGGANLSSSSSPARPATSGGATSVATQSRPPLAPARMEARLPTPGGARQQGPHRHDPPAAGHQAAPAGRGRRSGSAPPASSKPDHHATPSPGHGRPAQPPPPATPAPNATGGRSPAAGGTAPAGSTGDHPPPPAAGHRH
jgi:RNA polymerase sigma factor (sigma-70 family)